MLQPLESPETNNLLKIATPHGLPHHEYQIYKSLHLLAGVHHLSPTFSKVEKLRYTSSKCALFLRLILASQENAWHAHAQAYSNDSLSESSFDALTWACEMNPALISATLVKARKHQCAAKSEHRNKTLPA